MSPSDGGESRVGPMLVYEGVQKIEVWKAVELGEEYARMKISFGPGSNTLFTIPLDIYDMLLRVERDLIRFKKGPRAKLEE